MEQEDKNKIADKEEKKIVEEVSTVEKVESEQPSKNFAERPKRRAFGKKPGGKNPAAVDSDHVEKVLSIRRVTKVTKGGKRLSFSALVVVGDTKGNVGYAQEKAREVATAIRKAMGTAKKSMVKVTMKGTTIPHEIIGAWGGARVLLKPAAEGTGVIASGPVRAVCEAAGIHNILTKCHRSNNPINVVKATVQGLTHLKTSKH
jgi:small subunit ribosomal protein S5